MRRTLRPQIFLALAATLLLRAMIPAGFMPAAIGAGFPLQVCPSGLPDGALARLAGEHAAHHHHAGHGHHGHHDPAGSGDGGHAYSAEQCPIAHLIAAAALPVSAGPAVPALPAPAIVAPVPRHPATAPLHQYRSRGPPVPAAT